MSIIFMHQVPGQLLGWMKKANIVPNARTEEERKMVQ